MTDLSGKYEGRLSVSHKGRRWAAMVAALVLAACGTAEGATQTQEDALVGLPGEVRTLSGAISLPHATRAAWLDDRRILYASADHRLAVFDARTGKSRELAVPVPDTRLEANWHWVVSPDRRWAFVSRSEVESRKYPHGAPSHIYAEARKLNWSGFVDLASGAAVAYEGYGVAWQGSRCLVQIGHRRGPLLLVDPLDPARAKWLFDEVGGISAVAPNGRHAAAFDGGPASYLLLDLVAGRATRIDSSYDCASAVAFSADSRHLVTATASCKGATARAQVRTLTDGRVVLEARLPDVESVYRLAPLAGTPSRLVLLAGSSKTGRLVMLTLGDKVAVEHVAEVPPAAYPAYVVESGRGTLYWLAQSHSIVRYERGRAVNATADGIRATFVSLRDPTWSYDSHVLSMAYRVYWPSDKARERACASAADCIAQGTAWITGASGRADRAKGLALLEDGCGLHDGSACFALAHEIERGSLTERTANIHVLYQKACRIGVASACNALGTAGAARSNAPITAIAMENNAVCALRSDRSITCHNIEAAPPGEYTAVSVGGAHACGLRPDGAAVCWGAGVHEPTNDPRWSDFGQSRPPRDRFSMLAAGSRHTCGVRVDGTVLCWGSDEHGQASPPSGIRLRSISAGQAHTCGVRHDDSVVCWGAGTYDDGQLRSWQSGQANPPRGRFLTVSASSTHSCGLTTTQAIRCWGSNRGWTGTRDDKARPPQGAFKDVAAGNLHTCAIGMDGALRCWGSNSDGQVGSRSGRFTQVVTGSQSACALAEDGSVTCWGLHFNRSAGVTLWPATR